MVGQVWMARHVSLIAGIVGSIHRPACAPRNRPLTLRHFLVAQGSRAQIDKLRRARRTAPVAGAERGEVAKMLASSLSTVSSATNMGPVGAENSVTLCDLQVFVYEATEPVSSQRPDGRSGGPIGAACGRLLMERSVRTVGVVMLDVLAQHRREVTRSGDQEMIEAFTAQSADEAFVNRRRFAAGWVHVDGRLIRGHRRP
jgi:hypothetical protein